MMKNKKKIVLGALSGLLLLSNTSLQTYAESENTEKEEVVYVNLNENGSVQDITVVNIFDLNKAQKVIDYGNYTSVRNMTSTSAINMENDEITIETTSAEKLYYEGKMSSTSIPWNININYYLDGKNVNSETLAGSSGHLKIQMDITKNDAYDGNFYEGYALQASLSLDSNKCKNITSDNATIANVGSNKQLSYIILPNKNTTINIESDVVDFEMDAIAINAVKLNLSLDVDDSKIQDKVDTLTDAVNELDDGAKDLKNGSSDLYSATTTLKDNSAKLSEGVEKIYSGAKTLADGVTTLDSKSNTLVSGADTAFDGLCSAINEVLNEKLNEYGLDSVTLTKDNYSTVLNELLKKLDADAVYEEAYNVALATVTSEVTAAVEEMGEEIYSQYITQNSEAIIQKYVSSNRETLYKNVAIQAVLQELMNKGMSEEVAKAYIATEEGQALVNQTYEKMLEDTDTYDAQIIDGLTNEQKESILNGALQSLTDEEKAAIKQGIISKTIEEKMVSDEVQSQIYAAVEKVNAAAGIVSTLKGKLDQFAVFTQGVKDYTSAVSTIKDGTISLKDSLGTLNENMYTLKDGTVTLNDAVKKLYDGTDTLKEGTTEFKEKTDNLSSEVSDEIDDMVNELTGSDVEVESFVSSKNTNIQAVQFVIKTSGISKTATETETTEVSESLTFIQKLFKLFGIN